MEAKEPNVSHSGNKNGIAIAGFVCSIVGFFTCGVTSIVGLILSIIGLNKSKESDGNGKGMAVAGIVLSSIIIFTFIILFATGVMASMLSSSTSTSKENKSKTKNQSQKVEKFSYEITNEYDEYSTHYIEGVVTNNKDKDYSYVGIEFICYDSEGNNLGTAIDNTNNLLGNQTWKFKAFIWVTDVEVDHCDFHEIDGL